MDLGIKAIPQPQYEMQLKNMDEIILNMKFYLKT